MPKTTIQWPILLVLAFFHGCSGQTSPRLDEFRDWKVYGGDPGGTRYSALDKINRQNVSQLRLAWTFDTEDAFAGSEMQCNPIVANGLLYATTPKLRVVALDAATGQLRWSFNPQTGQPAAGKVRNRGVTYWEEGDDRRILFVFRHHLYALNAETGEPMAGFGNSGRVDLRRGLGRDPEQLFVGATSPGIVYRDLIILGSLVNESLPSAPGDIRAYDVRTGELRWSFHAIPHPGEPGHETWPENAWTYSGGANAWAGMALDLERGLVFCPTGSAAFDFYGGNRAGDNLFANSLIALDAATGKRIWHFQIVRHDVWDRDLPAPPTLVAVERDGQMIDSVAQITKSGHVFVFERDSGKPLFPVADRAVPASDIPGESLARTQPLPEKPPPFARQVLTEEFLTNRNPEARQAVLEQFRKLRSGGQFTPPSLEGTIIFPGYDGGGEWGGAAFDPQTRLLYVNSNEMAWILQVIKRDATERPETAKELYRRDCAGCHGDELKGNPPDIPALLRMSDKYDSEDVSALISDGIGRMAGSPHLQTEAIQALTRYLLNGDDVPFDPSAAGDSPGQVGYAHGGYIKVLDPDGYPGVAPPWGTLNAIDLDRGEIRWTVPLGEYPELAERGMRNTGSENYGGPVVTAGGLLFIGATNFDKRFRAFDKETGELLWEATLPAAGNATPAVYEINGRQFVVIAAGGGKSGQPSGGSYVAFSLPD